MNLMVIETLLFSHIKSVIYMYKIKLFFESEMTIHKKLKALVLLSTLKHGNTPSNTYDLSRLVCKNLGNYVILVVK